MYELARKASSQVKWVLFGANSSDENLSFHCLQRHDFTAGRQHFTTAQLHWHISLAMVKQDIARGSSLTISCRQVVTSHHGTQTLDASRSSST